ncbi:MAG TPA: hypothetical protein VFV64_15550 [Permianibacter sp.]|nr:hypothetical protein [Permianibacter sp.]
MTGLRQNSLVGKQIAAAEYQMSSEQVVSEIMQKTPPKGVFVSLEALASICTGLMRQFARNITGQSTTVDGGCTTR